MKRRGFLKSFGILPLVAVAPAMALPKLWPGEDLATPRTVVELAASMDKLFQPYFKNSIKAYEDIMGHRYQHVTYALGKMVNDDRTEELIVRSLWMTMLTMRDKYTSQPMILWRMKPEYKEYNKFNETIWQEIPDTLRGAVRCRFSLMATCAADIANEGIRSPVAKAEGEKIRVMA